MHLYNITPTCFQLVTEKLKSTYAELKELTSPNEDFQHYRHEIQAVHQTSCVPRLSESISLTHMIRMYTYSYLPADLVLMGIEEVHKTHPDLLPGTKDVINFGKRREYARVIHELQRYQNYPYNLCPIEVILLILLKQSRGV